MGGNDENFVNCSKEDFELFDTMGTLDGRTYKERKMGKLAKELSPNLALNQFCAD